MAETPTFEHYDQSIADSFVRTSERATGIPAYLGAKVAEMGPGQLVATVDVRDEFLTPFGNIHGGVMAALVDHVLGCVLYPLMRRGQWAATTEFKLNYLAPVRSGQLVATSTVLSMTKRTAVVKVEVENRGRLACIAQGTLLIVDAK